MCKYMGLFRNFGWCPSPRRIYGAHDRLSSAVDVDMLDRDFLRTFAPMTIQSFEQDRVGPGELVGLAQVFGAAFERLFTDHGAPIALHRGVVSGNQLRGHHAFQLVLGLDSR